MTSVLKRVHRHLMLVLLIFASVKSMAAFEKIQNADTEARAKLMAWINRISWGDGTILYGHYVQDPQKFRCALGFDGTLGE